MPTVRYQVGTENSLRYNWCMRSKWEGPKNSLKFYVEYVIPNVLKACVIVSIVLYMVLEYFPPVASQLTVDTPFGEHYVIPLVAGIVVGLVINKFVHAWWSFGVLVFACVMVTQFGHLAVQNDELFNFTIFSD